MFDPDKRLLFYPSCGFAPYKLFELDFDQFVLADKGPRDNHSKEEFYRRLSRNVGGVELLEKRPDCRIFRKAGKDVYLFFNDNNDVLELIRSSACRIDCFIGIRDGCSEGGNYECVNDREFFSKILPLMPETGMDYITDHPELMFTRWGAGRRSERSERPCDELIIRDKRIVLSGKVALKLADNPISPVRRYKVSRHQPSVREWRTRTIRVTLEHDDITNWWSTLDGKFTSMRCRRWAGWTDRSNYRVAPDHFFKPSLKPGWTTEDSILLLLNMCLEMKWRTVGTTAFGEGDHSSLISALESWKCAYPEWIRIFHLGADDFADLRSVFRTVVSQEFGTVSPG